MNKEQILQCQDKNALQTLRNDLENTLHDNDYKDHKNHEATLRFLLKKYPELSAELPYDADTLHAERDEAREKIDAIDARVKELQAIEAEAAVSEEITDE